MASVEAGTVTAAIVLVNNATETEWFQRLAAPAASICFPNGRLQFWSPGRDTSTPLQGQAVLYLGMSRTCFGRHLRALGSCGDVMNTAPLAASDGAAQLAARSDVISTPALGGQQVTDGEQGGAVRLSPAGRAVLRACAASPKHFDATSSAGGCLNVADLVRVAPGSRTVARASLSRTLRRLWRAGWIELINGNGYSLTAQHAHADAALLAAERDPEGAYARAATAGGLFVFASPAEYLAYSAGTPPTSSAVGPCTSFK